MYLLDRSTDAPLDLVAHGPASLTIHGVVFPCRARSAGDGPAGGSAPVDAPARSAPELVARASSALTIRARRIMSDDFQAELRFLGIVSSPAFVRQPEGNGCIERFFRTLKEQLLWVRHFTDVEDMQTFCHDRSFTSNGLAHSSKHYRILGPLYVIAVQEYGNLPTPTRAPTSPDPTSEPW